MIPKMPFKREKKLESNPIITLYPNSDKFFVKNKAEKLELYSTAVLGNRGVWDYSDHPALNTGSAGQLSIVSQSGTTGEGCYLTNIDGTNKSTVLLPNTRVIDTSTHTITEEFILLNENLTSSDAELVDSCDVTTGWTRIFGDNWTLTAEDGRVKFAATADASARARMWKNYGAAFVNCKFIKVDVEFQSSDVATGNLYFELYDITTPKSVRWSGTRFAMAANTRQTFLFPILGSTDTLGMAPTAKTVPFNYSNTRIYIGMDVPATKSYTLYVDNVIADNGSPVYVEMNVPDELMESSLEIKCYDTTSSNYATTRIDRLDSTYSNVSVVSANTKFLDKTKLDNAYGTESGRAVFPKGDHNATVTGSTGEMTFSANRGTSKRIGFMVILPSVNTFSPDFSKIRFKIILSYKATSPITYAFSNDEKHFTGLRNLEKPLIGWFTETGIEFYMFDRPLKILNVVEDETKVCKVEIGATEGTKIYHGFTSHANKEKDSNSDDIPDIISVIESMCNRIKPVTVRVSPDPVVPVEPEPELDHIEFDTIGSTFAPIITVEGTPDILWTFSDNTTSTAVNPSINFGSAAFRTQKLTVTPWSALKWINIGFDGSDGGETPGGSNLAALAQQNVRDVRGLANAVGLVKWASKGNPIRSLNFSNNTALTIIECYMCTSLTSVNLANVSGLKRLCVENCKLLSLDLSHNLLLEDLRSASQGNITFSINWGTELFPNLWHICSRSNPHMTTTFPMSQFPALVELIMWNTSQSGTLDLSANPLLSWAQCSQNELTAINVTNCTVLDDLFANNNLLSESSLDELLQQLDTLGVNNGDLNISGNAAPSATGLTHITSLQARGWTIITN